MKNSVISFLKIFAAVFFGCLFALYFYNNFKFDYRIKFGPGPATPVDFAKMPEEKMPGENKPMPTKNPLPPKSDLAPHERACENEITQFCAAEKAAGQGVVGCLLDQANLNPECKTELAPFANRLAPCAAEAKKFCPGVRLGRGRLLECLVQNKEKIKTPACSQLL